MAAMCVVALCLLALAASSQAASRGLPKRDLIIKAGGKRVVVGDSPAPKWYNTFSVEFNESTKILWRRETTGTWWYDAQQDVEVVERENGNGDRYCGSIHPIQSTPCRHLVTGGNRYLIFPDLDTCCLCCTAEHGCGTLRPDWLDAATFQGQEEQRGIPVYKWTVQGLQANNYYSTADELQLPVELDQEPNDRMSFDLDTFDPSPLIPPDLLEVPADCHAYCPISSVCTLLRQGGACRRTHKYKDK